MTVGVSEVLLIDTILRRGESDTGPAGLGKGAVDGLTHDYTAVASPGEESAEPAMGDLGTEARHLRCPPTREFHRSLELIRVVDVGQELVDDVRPDQTLAQGAPRCLTPLTLPRLGLDQQLLGKRRVVDVAPGAQLLKNIVRLVSVEPLVQGRAQHFCLAEPPTPKTSDDAIPHGGKDIVRHECHDSL
nr:hypothetical protein [Mycetocola reblochoni]